MKKDILFASVADCALAATAPPMTVVAKAARKAVCLIVLDICSLHLKYLKVKATRVLGSRLVGDVHLIESRSMVSTPSEYSIW